ncbi:MAG: hypothetical protein QXS42_06600 [Zestosphaera sp.]
MVKKRGKGKGAKTGEGEGKPGETEVQEAVKGGGKERKSARRSVDVDAWVEENVDEFVALAGLTSLGLSRDQYIDLLRDILTQLYGSPTTYTSVETVVKRYSRHKDGINEIVANRLVQMLETLTPEQLDFVVLSVKDSALIVAPRIYHQLVRNGREDLIEVLRIKWFKAWLARRYRSPPLICPVCNFNSLMPDLTCAVCGATVSERRLKRDVNFERMLREYVSELSCSDLKELLNYDTILLSSEGLKHPALVRGPVDVEVYLSLAEKRLIRDMYTSRCRSSGDESPR